MEKPLNPPMNGWFNWGRKPGSDYRFGKAERIPNTFNAHRVLWLAAREGQSKEATEALFKAYFTEGKDLGNVQVLAQIASSVGLDLKRVEDFLAGAEGEKEVREQEEKAYSLGIPGVPFFIFYGPSSATQGKPVGFSGAQDVPTFLKVITQASV